MYDCARLPKDKKLLIDINSAAGRLFDKLRDLDVNALSISDYNKRYFGEKLVSLVIDLQAYSYLLAWSLFKSEYKSSKFVFLEYGGGTGMLSLLAKELGMGNVIYNDIYDVSCHDSKCIAKSIENEADYYIPGDIDDVLVFLRKENINCNAVASCDVIEHIYDIKSFFRKIPLLSDSALNVVMSSAANIFNPSIRKAYMAAAVEVEHKDREKIWGHKERDCLKSYLKVRSEMVCEYLQELDEKLSEVEIAQLAKNTRGMIKPDILKCVDDYLNTGKYPPELKHPTNTCDPYTGNWAEHLMDPYNLSNILSETGFEAEVLNGYRGCTNNGIAGRFINACKNKYISIFPKRGIRLSPFYTIYGRRD